jgi:ElaB/YqjD/DUF883 family membrane-anchored ribosome-binding protein
MTERQPSGTLSPVFPVLSSCYGVFCCVAQPLQDQPKKFYPFKIEKQEKSMETNYPGDLSSGMEMDADDQNGATSGADLRRDLADLKKDLDALLAKASTLTDRELRDARDRLLARFGTMRVAAQDIAGQAQEQLNRGVDMTSEYVKESPMQALAIAAGIGLVLGAITRR